MKQLQCINLGITAFTNLLEFNGEIECRLYAFTDLLGTHDWPNQVLQNRSATGNEIHLKQRLNILKRTKFFWKEQTLTTTKAYYQCFAETYILLWMCNIDITHTQATLGGTSLAPARSARQICTKPVSF